MPILVPHAKDRRPSKYGVPLYRGAQVRRADAAIIASGVAGYELMGRAAVAALRALRARWPVARDLLVLCGSGNNGGDGYVLARLARAAGLSARVIALTAPGQLRGDAARAAADCRAAGVVILEDPAAGEHASATLERLVRYELARCDVLIDAMLGIGLIDEVRGRVGRILTLLDGDDARGAKRRPVVALDIPSGLCADTGRVRGVALRADLTVSFILHKAGLFLDQGPALAGELLLDDLGADGQLAAAAAGSPLLYALDAALLREVMPHRSRAAHKGEAGHVLVIGGGSGMPGAARLAGEAALRAGAGRVSVLCDNASVVSIAAGRAELMVQAIESFEELSRRVVAADVLAIGPGLGTSDWARAVVAAALAAAQRALRPTVIDADALNILAADASAIELPRDCVLTPHPGEAGRLLGIGSTAVQADRLAALSALQSRFAATIVLKGAGSLVSGGLSDEPPWLCTAGNPAMAAPGMGDVLTGVVAALLGQGARPVDAARLGVLWHALAGDAAADGTDRGVLASELSKQLPITAARYFV